MFVLQNHNKKRLQQSSPFWREDDPHLRGRTDLVGPECAWRLPLPRAGLHGETARLLAVLLPAAVALLALLYHSVAADGRLRRRKAAFDVARFRVEDAVDLLQRARRELVVVSFISRSRPEKRKRISDHEHPLWQHNQKHIYIFCHLFLLRTFLPPRS